MRLLRVGKRFINVDEILTAEVTGEPATPPAGKAPHRGSAKSSVAKPATPPDPADTGKPASEDFAVSLLLSSGSAADFKGGDAQLVYDFLVDVTK